MNEKAAFAERLTAAMKRAGLEPRPSVLEKEFNTRCGEISPGGEVTIEFVECLASCGTGPVVLIDDDLHEKVDAAKAKALADQIKQEAARRA